jgi:hypothetical protein
MPVEKQDERKVAGASYIQNFAIDIEALTINFSNYINLLLELESKYGNKQSDLDKSTDEEKDYLKKFIQAVRQSCISCYVKYVSVVRGLKQKEDKAITKLYHEIKNNMVLSRDTLEKFTIELNSFITLDIVKNLLETSRIAAETVYHD